MKPKCLKSIEIKADISHDGVSSVALMGNCKAKWSSASSYLWELDEMI